jgi:hypothetical protein
VESCWSGFDLTLDSGVVAGMNCSWSAAVLAVACLQKTVGDLAA